MPVHDAVIVLEMPECIVKEANDVADRHFLKRAKVPLKEFLARGGQGNFYLLLGDAIPQGDALCPLKKLYRELAQGDKTSVSGLIVMQYTAKIFPTRAYDIFRIHAKLIGEKEMAVRFMPFPHEMMLRIVCNSEECMVEVPPLYSQVIPRARIDDAFIASALSEAWEKIDSDHDLKLMSKKSGDDENRLRYLKLHLPLEELEAQDVYLGWLPMDKPYSEIRGEVLDELYGCD